MWKFSQEKVNLKDVKFFVNASVQHSQLWCCVINRRLISSLYSFEHSRSSKSFIFPTFSLFHISIPSSYLLL